MKNRAGISPLARAARRSRLAPMTATIDPDLPMGELLQAYPSARRALFKGYHIGGCASCGFQAGGNARPGLRPQWRASRWVK